MVSWLMWSACPHFLGSLDWHWPFKSHRMIWVKTDQWQTTGTKGEPCTLVWACTVLVLSCLSTLVSIASELCRNRIAPEVLLSGGITHGTSPQGLGSWRCCEIWLERKLEQIGNQSWSVLFHLKCQHFWNAEISHGNKQINYFALKRCITQLIVDHRMNILILPYWIATLKLNDNHTHIIE